LRGLKPPADLLHVSICVPAGVGADLLCIALSLRSESTLMICLPLGFRADLFRLSPGLRSELAAERVLLVEALAKERVEAAERKPPDDQLQMLADGRALVSTKRARKVTHHQVAEGGRHGGELVVDRLLSPIPVGCVDLRRFRLFRARSKVLPHRARDKRSSIAPRPLTKLCGAWTRVERAAARATLIRRLFPALRDSAMGGLHRFHR
jgi:hypothetical protein